MNHKGTVKLETERLNLRRFVIEDAKEMFENWASEDEVTKFLTWPTHKDVENTKLVLKYFSGNAVIKYLFEEVGFHRIAANHDKNNPKSGKVMQKIGMTYEGTLRSAGFCNQGVIDDVWYSILREEFEVCGGKL